MNSPQAAWTCESIGCAGLTPGLSAFRFTTLGKSFTRMCLCHQPVYFGTGQGSVMPCGWEVNRRSDVALSMRHSLQWFIHLRAHGLGRWAPTCSPVKGMAPSLGLQPSCCGTFPLSPLPHSMLPPHSLLCSVPSLPALGPWAPPAERGPSLESIYRVSLTVDLCEG